MLDRFTYQVFQFATSHNLIQANQKIIVSVSGGLDSISLFCVLDSFREKIPLELIIVHFHHGLRKESDEEEIFVRNLAKQKEVDCYVYYASDLNKTSGLQQNAREWRYNHLSQLKKETEADVIALGHHQDDLIETTIWKIVRGCSLFGLDALREKNGFYIRPLLQTSKKDLKKYLEQKNQLWMEDQSNQEEYYTRNKIRNQIIPLLRECSGGQFEEKITGLTKDSRQLDEFFCSSTHLKKNWNELSYKELLELPTIFAHELIHRFLNFHDQTEVTRRNIEKIMELVESGRGNWTLNLKNKKIILGKNKKLMIQDNT
ncbi:MAG: tRNA(Ile)-lysidine synthase [bacterium]|jgi:tRNA(Ile)-lysidine synthase